jgi:Co/Zn/Cd efflux system component
MTARTHRPVTLDAEGRAYRRVIWTIAGGILAFGALQSGWALAIGSRQLLKDGLDWAYDVILYGIAAFVFGRGVRIERMSAFGIALVLAVAGLHTLYDLWDKIANPRPIEIATITFSAVTAIAIAYLVIGALWRFRRNPNPLIRATWLSSRNDAVSTTFAAFIVMATRLAPVRWPEYAADLAFAGLSFQATWAILRAEWRDKRAEEGED